MASGIEILDLAVVCPLVGDVESGGDGAAVRIFPALLEQVRVETLVQVVHRIVERQQNYLRYLLRQVVTCFLLLLFFFIGKGGGGARGHTGGVSIVFVGLFVGGLSWRVDVGTCRRCGAMVSRVAADQRWWRVMGIARDGEVMRPGREIETE